jgi:hypothetical protein
MAEVSITQAPCRIELARSGCPILVPEEGHTFDDAIRWAQEVLGLSTTEIRPAPEHGASISLTGARKLAARVPDTKAKLEFMAWLQAEFPAI